MGLITFPYTIINATQSSHTELNENYDAISDEVNGNLDGSNFDEESELTFNTITLSSITTKKWQGGDTTTIKLPSNDGSHNVKFTDNNDTEILKIESDGQVTFHKRVSNALAVGTVLMYNGTGIYLAGSRTIEIGEDGNDTISMPGWYVCNGQTSTPNLIDKFIYGDSTPSGSTGGNDDAQIIQHNHTVNSATGLTGNESVAHTHTFSGTVGSTEPGHKHKWPAYSGTTGSSYPAVAINDQGDFVNSEYASMAHTHTLSGSSDNNSVTHTHTLTVNDYSSESATDKNIPPYYSLIFIIRKS